MMKLGDKVKDKITGFAGVAVAIAEYLNGCIQIGIRPEKLKDGKPIDLEWIDNTQLIITKSVKEKEKRDVGGPQVTPSGMEIPK